MKISLSIPEEDVNYLDEKAVENHFRSRSAVVVSAIRAMRQQDLTASYVEAFDEWAASGEDSLWEVTLNDGLVSRANPSHQVFAEEENRS